MAISNPALTQYFLQDDLYLLNEDKSFYANNLSEPEQETSAPKFNCLGSNNKGFLILVHYPQHEHMDPAHLKALESTLGRKALNLDDVAILNMAKYPDATFTDLNDFYKFQQLLILGEQSLLKELPQLQLNTITNTEVKQLYSFSFDEMLVNRDKARAFWDQMKNF